MASLKPEAHVPLFVAEITPAVYKDREWIVPNKAIGGLNGFLANLRKAVRGASGRTVVYTIDYK